MIKLNFSFDTAQVDCVSLVIDFRLFSQQLHEVVGVSDIRLYDTVQSSEDVERCRSKVMGWRALVDMLCHIELTAISTNKMYISLGLHSNRDKALTIDSDKSGLSHHDRISSAIRSVSTHCSLHITNSPTFLVAASHLTSQKS